ncbi:MAG TPA: heme ABC exporter ATP-binding protein CcmA [Xanthomonadales bacterium]|nr:heme ABC exporter ATP-binding protein CcmA [Xanthomonadales bacterium]
MLSVRHLTLERYFMPVFEPVSFTLSGGELLLVTGANGSGKTTLIRMLAGVLRPSQGEIRMEEGDSGSVGRVYVGHQLAVKDDLNVLENIRFMQAFLGAGEEQPEEIARQLGLQHVSHQAARTLSAGQRKRCALGRLHSPGRPLWLLDEPYSNLDREGMRMLDGLLARHLASGGACVMSTHGSLKPEGFEYRETELRAGTPPT